MGRNIGPEGRITAPFALPSVLDDQKDAERWVLWRWTLKDNGKWDKPPFRVFSPAAHASSTDDRTWGKLGGAKEMISEGLADGIGYMLRDDQERIFWDLDDCRDPATGEISDWAAEMVEEADSYTEITPSGTGLRIIGTHGGFLKAPIHSAYKLPNGGNGEVFFRAARYVTVSGQHLESTPTTLNDISGAVLELLAKAGKASAGVMPERQGDISASPIRDVLAALNCITNADLHYDEWVRVAMAIYAASGGSDAGLDAFLAWSGKSQKHEEAECLRLWNSIRRSPPKNISYGTLHYLAQAERPLFVPPSWRPEEDAEFRPAGGEQSAPQWDERPPADVFKTLSMEEVLALPPVEWRVKGWLTTDGFAVAYGAPGSFKSFIALDISLCIAYGLPWKGCEVKQGGVLYIAGEGVRGLKRRMVAWQRKHNLVGVDAPFRLLAAAVNLTDGEHVAKVVRTAVAAAEAEGFPVALVVVDTVARAIAGADENSAQDMGRLVAAVDQIREHCSTAVLGIHHSGKDKEKGARGSSALLGAVDTMIQVNRDEGTLCVTVKVEKQKDDEPPEPLRLEGEKISLDGRLNPETSLVFNGSNQRGSGSESTAEREGRLDMLRQIARALGPNGTLTSNKLLEALGLSSGGTGRAKISGVIPLGPDYVEIAADEGVVRLARIRSGSAETSPIVVRRYDV